VCYFTHANKLGWKITYRTTVEEMTGRMKGSSLEKGSDRSGKEICSERMKKEKKKPEKNKRKALTIEEFFSLPLARKDRIRKGHELCYYHFP